MADVVMPQLGGHALYERIRDRYPGIHVLYVSGYTDETIAHHGVLNAGVQFLQKPFSMATLLAKIRETLDER